MKTTFSYFPGMFENPAPAKTIFKKQNQKYYEILTIHNSGSARRCPWNKKIDFKPLLPQGTHGFPKKFRQLANIANI